MTVPESELSAPGDRRDYPHPAPDFFSSASDDAITIEHLTRKLASARRRLFETRMALAERAWRGTGDEASLRKAATAMKGANYKQVIRLNEEWERVQAELAAARDELIAREGELGLEPHSFSVQDFFRRRKTVVSIDLVDYSGDARYRQENFGVASVGELDARIRQMIERALRACGRDPSAAVIRFTGDGVTLDLDHPHQAIEFAETFFSHAQAHNSRTREARHRWWFRMGAADGELAYRQQGADRLEPAGEALIIAVRLQSKSRPGELLVDEGCFRACEGGRQDRFHRKAIAVAGKKPDETYRARRLVCLPEAAAEAERAGRWKPAR